MLFVIARVALTLVKPLRFEGMAQQTFSIQNMSRHVALFLFLRCWRHRFCVPDHSYIFIRVPGYDRYAIILTWYVTDAIRILVLKHRIRSFDGSRRLPVGDDDVNVVIHTQFFVDGQLLGRILHIFFLFLGHRIMAQGPLAKVASNCFTSHTINEAIDRVRTLIPLICVQSHCHLAWLLRDKLTLLYHSFVVRVAILRSMLRILLLFCLSNLLTVRVELSLLLIPIEFKLGWTLQ